MKPLLIGVGNPFRGDDAIGIEIVRYLEDRVGTSFDICYCQGDAMDLMDLWSQKELVFVVDAVSSGSEEIGHLFEFEAQNGPLPAVFSQTSTHLLDLSQAVELSRALGTLPARFIIYGIEGCNFTLEEGMSDELISMLPTIASRIEAGIFQLANKA